METGIGEKIKQLRLEHDLTMDMLIADINSKFDLEKPMNKSMLSRWESGINDPSLENTKYLSIYPWLQLAKCAIIQLLSFCFIFHRTKILSLKEPPGMDGSFTYRLISFLISSLIYPCLLPTSVSLAKMSASVLVLSLRATLTVLFRSYRSCGVSRLR